MTGIHGGEVIGFVAGLSESAPSLVLSWTHGAGVGLGELCTGTPAPVEILHSKSIIEFHRTYKAVIVKPDPLPNPPQSTHRLLCIVSGGYALSHGVMWVHPTREAAGGRSCPGPPVAGVLTRVWVNRAVECTFQHGWPAKGTITESCMSNSPAFFPLCGFFGTVFRKTRFR